MSCCLATLYGTSQLYRTAEQQQLFGQCGLTGIWVRNDSEGAPASDFVVGFHQTVIFGAQLPKYTGERGLGGES